jgi:hypothetical protein
MEKLNGCRCKHHDDVSSAGIDSKNIVEIGALGGSFPTFAVSIA